MKVKFIRRLSVVGAMLLILPVLCVTAYSYYQKTMVPEETKALSVTESTDPVIAVSDSHPEEDMPEATECEWNTPASDEEVTDPAKRDVEKTNAPETLHAEEADAVPAESNTAAEDLEELPEETVEIDFAEVNETVYTTTGVNVRTGPGVEYERIDTLAYGKSIVRTGIGSNGWSRVLYNGQDAYMCSEYLTDSKPAAGPSGGKLGTAGRLTIPSVGVDVALYHCLSSSEYDSLQQSIVDAVDSAAYIEQCHVDGVLIADHKHQGFNAMKNSVPNETYAYIDFGSYTQTYICTAIGNGKNLGSDLVDWDGVSLNHDYIRHGLAMYTCNENSTNITISYWKPV